MVFGRGISGVHQNPVKVKKENLVKASKQIFLFTGEGFSLNSGFRIFLFTGNGFSLISGFTKCLSSPEKPLNHVNKRITNI